jgi:hypothetical protein
MNVRTSVSLSAAQNAFGFSKNAIEQGKIYEADGVESFSGGVLGQ